MGEDRTLVSEVLAARKGAMERFVREYQGVCWRVLYRMTGDREDARELSQDVFMRAYHALPSFRFDASLKTWLTRIAWSVGVRHLEKRRLPIDVHADIDLIADHEAGTDDVESVAMQAQMHAMLRQALDTLPPVQRALLTLYHLEDMALPEIAEVTSMPIGTIKSHLFRGRAALRLRLMHHLEPAP